MKKIVLLFLCLTVMGVHAARIVDGINYELNREEMYALVVKLDYPNKYSGDIVIPETIVIGEYEFDVLGIDEEAFEGCPITSISLPESIQLIDDNAFASCTKLTSIKLPDSVWGIGNEAFYNCRNVTELKLPRNEVLVLDCAFAYMQSLKEIVFPDEWTMIGYPETVTDFFKGCTSLKRIVLGKNIQAIYAGAFHECESLKEVICPADGVLEYIGEEAFAETGLESMRFLPKTVKHIDTDAFSECPNLKEFFIPASVEQLGGVNSLDYRCTSLVFEDTKVPLKLLGMDHSAFEEMYLGRPIESSQSYLPCGRNMLALKKLVFGASFSADTNWYFGNHVTDIYSYASNPAPIKCKFTDQTYDNATLYVPKGTKSAYASQSNFAPFFIINEMTDEQTGIHDMSDMHAGDATVYTMGGSRVRRPVRGLNIINGKKVLVK